MAVLSWGRPLIEIALLGENETPGEWKSLGTPKQDSSQLSTEAGNKTEAIEEGGGVVDVRYDKSKYSFVCQLFSKKGETKPIEDVDGIVPGNYAVRLTPEDPTTPGWIMDKASVSVVDTWSAADGGLWQ